MICLRCLARQPSSMGAVRQSLRSSAARRQQSTRLFSQQTRHLDATQPFTTPPAASRSSRHISTSSAASAPATTIPPSTNASANSTPAATGTSGSSSRALRSGTPAGSVLRGLNFHKDKSDPLAMEDSEYPEWLWTVLDEIRGPNSPGAKDRKADTTKASKKKKDKKGASLEREEVPIHRQTIDLPTSDGTLDSATFAAAARAQITKAMRAERRAKIKESNFLKTMR